MTLNKSLDLSEPQFPICKTWMTIVITLWSEMSYNTSCVESRSGHSKYAVGYSCDRYYHSKLHAYVHAHTHL